MKMKTKKLVIPQGLSLTSIMKYNKPDYYLAYVFATNKPRNYEDLIGLNTNLLSGYFKGKTFGIELKGTPISSDWYLKSLSINPNAYGDNVPAHTLDGLLKLFADSPKNYSYSDFWADVKRPISVRYITHDINGKPLNVPLQATAANVKLWNEGYEEKKERDEQLLIDERKKVTSSRFYVNCKKRKTEAQKFLDEVDIPTGQREETEIDTDEKINDDSSEIPFNIEEDDTYNKIEYAPNNEVWIKINEAEKVVSTNCYQYALKALEKEKNIQKVVPAIGIGLGLFFLG